MYILLRKHAYFLQYPTCIVLACGGLLTAPSGTFSSPGSPGNYPHDRNCTWDIVLPAGNRVQLQFSVLQLESHPNCSYDFVKVLDATSDNARVLATYCHRTLPLPPVLLTSGPTARVIFHSDSSNSDNGLILNYATRRLL